MTQAVLISPRQAATLRKSSRKVRFQLPGNRRFGMDQGPEPAIWCRVIDADPISGATATIGGVSQVIRWTYTLRRVRWDYATQSWFDLADLPDVYGTNSNEDGNNSTAVGPGYLCATVPAGLEYCPAGYAAGGYLMEQFAVPCQAVTDPDLTVTFKFHHANTFDGECE